MVFQGDARNELGPSPRGAIYRKHQKTTSVETSFHKKFGTELPRLEYCRERKPATTPKPQASGPRESTNSNYKNQAARPLKNTSGGNRRAQPSLSSGGMACALTSKNSQSPKSKCSADQRKPARRARLRQPKEPLKGSARRGPSSASVAR